MTTIFFSLPFFWIMTLLSVSGIGVEPTNVYKRLGNSRQSSSFTQILSESKGKWIHRFKRDDTAETPTVAFEEDESSTDAAVSSTLMPTESDEGVEVEKSLTEAVDETVEETITPSSTDSSRTLSTFGEVVRSMEASEFSTLKKISPYESRVNVMKNAALNRHNDGTASIHSTGLVNSTCTVKSYRKEKKTVQPFRDDSEDEANKQMLDDVDADDLVEDTYDSAREHSLASFYLILTLIPLSLIEWRNKC